MKFTIEASERVVCLGEDGTPALCRVFVGTAENGAQVRLAVAHCAVSARSPGWEVVHEYFNALDKDGLRKVRLGDFLVQLSETEEVEPMERGQA